MDSRANETRADVNFSLSPPRVAFSRVGDFHARSRFARSPIPEEKRGTTRSLPYLERDMTIFEPNLSPTPTLLNTAT